MCPLMSSCPLYRTDYIQVEIISTIHSMEKMELPFIDSDLLYRGGGRSGHDCIMAVEFTTTYAISAYHH
jgi:hypothetical protein